MKIKHFLIVLMLLYSASSLYSQNIEVTYNQRRAYDQIHVEIWAKALNQNAPKIGYASLILNYDPNFLTPAAVQNPTVTDTIKYNFNQLDPITEITSEFHQNNGYNGITNRAYGNEHYSLEITLNELGSQGLIPISTGKGYFLGKLIFDITGDPDQQDITGIEWSTSTLPGDTRIFDADSTDIESQVRFTDEGDFTVTGLTLLSPNSLGQVVDRDQDYLSLTGDYEGGGVPIYFERSINPNDYESPVDNDLAYSLEYSLNNGGTWVEFGRVAEAQESSSTTGLNPFLRSGEVFNPSTGNSFVISDQLGNQLNDDTYRRPVRTIWAKNPFYIERSEQARLRVVQLQDDSNLEIRNRTKSTISDQSNERLVLGRLFFLQLNGEDQYLKTEDNFSNSTQLTVETWLNLNSYKPTGSETGIIASSGGPDAQEYLGSTEGAWMLYLRDGRYPAFRVREIEGRGDGNLYLGDITTYSLDMLSIASDAEPLSDAHADNWVHLAGVVRDNTMMLYVNGELVESYTNTNATDIRMMTSNQPVWIGVNPNGDIDDSDFLNAGIKSVRIWRNALTQQEIRTRAAGVVEPNNVNDYGGVRRTLDMYYSFEGTDIDEADNAIYQNGAEVLEYIDPELGNIKYRPDKPHIRITSPSGGAGVPNREFEYTQIRWISYGMGDIANENSNDVVIEYSTDFGANWFPARDSLGQDYSGTNRPDVESTITTWEPYENDTDASLRSIDPYSKPTILRIRGTAENSQANLMDITDEFTVAPYFSIRRDTRQILAVDGTDGMNVTGNEAFIETWIRPYRFPTISEEYFPIVEKIDSLTGESHYSIRLLNDGRLQFRVTDSDGNDRVAESAAHHPVERPNSLAIDSSWTHIAVYFNTNAGEGTSDVIFYIDGFPQSADSIRTQLGDNLVLNTQNTYPTFLGYYPSIENEAGDVEPAIQTNTVALGGNINSGTPQGSSVSTSSNIYDGEGNSYILGFIFTKTAATNQYNISYSIDGNDVPRQTENITVAGNLNTDNPEGETFELNAVINDYNNENRDLELTFARGANNNEYTLTINIDGILINTENIEFDEQGIPIDNQFIITAAELNAQFGEDTFDQNEPKNLIIDISNLLLSTEDNQLEVDTQPITLQFNNSGDVIGNLSYTIKALDLNNALGIEAFDQATPNNLVFSLDDITHQTNISTISIVEQNGQPETSTTDSRGFIGEFREFRFWNDSPNNLNATGSEPSELTTFLQGALNQRTDELSQSNRGNLFNAFDLNGGTFVENGEVRAMANSVIGDATVKNFASRITYVASEPYFKLVEPKFKQSVSNSTQDLRVRWVGFDYNGLEFEPGDNNSEPSLEFSIRGGGGQIIQPYQFLAGEYWNIQQDNSISFPDSTTYRFGSGAEEFIFASNVDVSIADPDENNDGVFDDQGQLSASLTNARLRLTGYSTINGDTLEIMSESKLFTITPESNFTLRVLLEGYHNGLVPNQFMRNLGSSYEEGGLRIKLYRNNSGGIGQLVDSADSENGYVSINPGNRNNQTNDFGNVNFVFTDITDGEYWVLVEHINHLPVLSRFPATFLFEGDNVNTWEIESGWDFQTWNGVTNNVLNSPSISPYLNNAFTAFGSASSDSTSTEYSTTGLIFNDGRSGTNTNPLSAMVGGDVDQSGQIDAADRLRVRLDWGSTLNRSDVTGDGFVNADDRTIVDRNSGRVSSVFAVNFPLIDSETQTKNNDITNQINQKSKQSGDILLNDAIRYEVSAEPEFEGEVIKVPMYILNQGADFAPANCTFALQYNPNVLQFLALSEEDSVIFSNQPEFGYAPIKSAPNENTTNPLPNVRTIEIDYDRFTNPGGIMLPREKTYLGTLSFRLKSTASAVIFKWHESTSVHAVDGRIVTPDGTFKDIPITLLYDLDLVQPNGGEEIAQNSLFQIQWDTDGRDYVHLEYTTNAGVQWQRATTDSVSLQNESFTWQVPNSTSSMCLMRIMDASIGIELERSDAYFAIIQRFAQLLKPSAADPVYRGGTTDMLRWENKGYENIRFEFSSDGGTTWSPIQATTQGVTESSWRIPKVTTVAAIVRMIDADTDEELTRSGLFKILTGAVAFRNPRRNEDLLIGRTTAIRWSSVDVDFFDLGISYDGGSTWDNIQTSVVAGNQQLSWDVPNNPTQQAVLRAIWGGDPQMEYGRSDQFNIVVANSIVDNYAKSNKLQIYPNPAREQFFIENLPKEKEIQNLEIINLKGEIVLSLEKSMFRIYEPKIDIRNLAPGMYIVRINYPEGNYTGELIIEGK